MLYKCFFGGPIVSTPYHAFKYLVDKCTCAALYMYQATMPVGTPHLSGPEADIHCSDSLLMHHLEIWEKYISSTFFLEELCFPTRGAHSLVGKLVSQGKGREMREN